MPWSKRLLLELEGIVMDLVGIWFVMYGNHEPLHVEPLAGLLYRPGCRHRSLRLRGRRRAAPWADFCRKEVLNPVV